MSQPVRTYSRASQSSSSGWLGEVALRAEILLGLHQPDAEELRPEPVDGDPGRERVLRVDEPRRQAEPVARGPLGERVERGRDAGLDPLAGVEEVPLHHEMRSCAACPAGSSTITGRVGISGLAFSSRAISSRTGWSAGAIER